MSSKTNLTLTEQKESDLLVDMILHPDKYPVEKRESTFDYDKCCPECGRDYND